MSSEAIVVYRRLLELIPNDADALDAIAWHLHQNGDLTQAISAARQALAVSPESPATLLTAGTVLLASGEQEQARSLLEKAVAVGAPELRVNEILIQHDLATGDFDRAASLSRAMAKADPDSARAFKSLARSKRFTSEDGDTRLIRTLIDENGQLRASMEGSSRDRAEALWALYKMESDLGNHEIAWNHLEQIKEPLRKAATNDVIANNETFHAKVTSVFTKEFLQQRSQSASKASDPIFVIGLPRSGTTLLDRLISTSSRVVAAGERTEIEDVRKVLCKQFGHDENDVGALGSTSLNAWNSAAAEYLMRVKRNLPPAEFFVDKMPGNFVNLGFIRSLFPSAKVIHIHRNPMATCFSLYEQDFGARLQYNLDQETLGRYYLQYHRLMEHWRQSLLGGFFEISYEDLVSDLTSSARALSEYLEIELDPEAMTSSQVDGSVQTASQFQVRQPIYTTSLNKWKDYAPYLSTLKETLAPVLEDV